MSSGGGESIGTEWQPWWYTPPDRQHGSKALTVPSLCFWPWNHPHSLQCGQLKCKEEDCKHGSPPCYPCSDTPHQTPTGYSQMHDNNNNENTVDSFNMYVAFKGILKYIFIWCEFVTLNWWVFGGLSVVKGPDVDPCGMPLLFSTPLLTPCFWVCWYCM